MKIRAISPIGILCLMIFSLPAWSHIYKWQDQERIPYFSDSPPQGQGLIVEKAKKTEGALKGVEDPRKPTSPQLEGKRSNGDIRVIMYMTDWCGYCRQAREYLHALGVDLTEYDIEKNKEKREEMRKLGGRGVPLIDVEGILIKGYNPGRIKDAVEKRKKNPQRQGLF